MENKLVHKFYELFVDADNPSCYPNHFDLDEFDDEDIEYGASICLKEQGFDGFSQYINENSIDLEKLSFEDISQNDIEKYGLPTSKIRFDFGKYYLAAIMIDMVIDDYNASSDDDEEDTEFYECDDERRKEWASEIYNDMISGRIKDDPDEVYNCIFEGII